MDACLYFKWINGKLCMWLTWSDDYLIAGEKETVLREKEKTKKLFECDGVGELVEYVGCKVEFNEEERSLKLTQPVMIQSLHDKFDLPTDGAEPTIPAEAGEVLTGGEKAPERNLMAKREQML